MSEKNESKKKYKQLTCNICNKTYGINYYYQHLKMKSHLRKKNKKECKLLVIENDTVNKNNAKLLLNEVIEKINNIINILG